MRRLHHLRMVGLVLTVPAWLVLAGCGGDTLPPAAEPGQAREALQTALACWQKGESSQALAGLAQPIHVVDEDWHAGRRLLRYQVTDDGKRLGLNLCYAVALSLQDPRGKTVEKKVHYSVVTSPNIVIVREDRGRS